MVTVVDPKPHYSVLHTTHCKNCGATLQYVPKDVKHRQVSCMGDIDTYYYIDCPQCGKDTPSVHVWND